MSPSAGQKEFAGNARFDIVNRIGVGGMGIVFEAQDRHRQIRVALKTLPGLDPVALYRFKLEFRALTGISHPNLVVLHELFSDDDQWFFSMEYIEGHSFLQHVQSTQAVPSTNDEPTLTLVSPVETPQSAPGIAAHSCDYERLRQVLRQLADGLCYLHEHGKLHRDIKPSNVMVDRTGRVVLLDFGLIAEIDERDGRTEADRNSSGTPGFMSPEQAKGHPLSESSDWYSVGAMVYEAINGRLWRTGEPVVFPDDVPADLKQLCSALLDQDPERRPTGAEVRRMLGEEVPAAAADARIFVGRKTELQQLRYAYARAFRGNGVVVAVHGMSGAGKSALIDHFLSEVRLEQTAVVLASRCYEQESVPYKAFDGLIDGIAKYLSALSEQGAAELLPRNVERLAHVFPVLRRVKGIAGARRGLEQLDVQEARRRTFQAIREMFGRMAERSPVTLFIDDLQWGDSDSAVIVADLLRPPDAPPLFLICAFRDGFEENCPGLQALLASLRQDGVEYHDLPLRELDANASRELATAILGHRDSQLADAIHQEAGGNPYFIRELIQNTRSLRSGEATTLDAVIQHRVAALPESAARLLEVVAVAARPIGQWEAYAAAGLEQMDPGPMLLLRNNRLIRSAASLEHDQMETYHDRVRESVAGYLASESLRSVHLRLALAHQSSGRADSETVAIHFEKGGEPLKAGRYFVDAAQNAMAQLAFDSAAHLYQRGLELLPLSGPDLQSLRLALAEALTNAGRGFHAAQAYSQAALGASGTERWDLERKSAYQFCISGHLDEGRAAFASVLNTVGLRLPATKRQSIADLLWGRMLLNLRGTRFQERSTVEIAPKVLSRADAAWSVGSSLSMMDLYAGMPLVSRAALLALRAGEPGRILRALSFAAVQTAVEGDSGRKRGRQWLDVCAGILKRQNTPLNRAYMALMEGSFAFLNVRFSDAHQLLGEAERMFTEECTGVRWEISTARTIVLWVLQGSGRYKELGARTRSYFTDAQRHGDLFALVNIGGYNLPNAYLVDGDPAGARKVRQETLAAWPVVGYSLQKLVACIGESGTLLYEDRPREALALIDREWPVMSANFLLRADNNRIYIMEARARAALATAWITDSPKQRVDLAHRAERDAKSLQKESLPHGPPMGMAVLAGLAALGGDRNCAIRHLEQAITGFDKIQASMLAAASRLRLGQLLDGESGRGLIAQAEAAMRREAVKDMLSMCRALGPRCE